MRRVVVALYVTLLISISVLSFKIGKYGVIDDIKVKWTIKRADYGVRRDFAARYISQDSILSLKLRLIGEHEDESSEWEEIMLNHIIAFDFLKNGVLEYKFSNSIRENVEQYIENLPSVEKILRENSYNMIYNIELFESNRDLLIDNVTMICCDLNNSFFTLYK